MRRGLAFIPFLFPQQVQIWPNLKTWNKYQQIIVTAGKLLHFQTSLSAVYQIWKKWWNRLWRKVPTFSQMAKQKHTDVRCVERKTIAQTLRSTLSQIIWREFPFLATFVKRHSGQDVPLICTTHIIMNKNQNIFLIWFFCAGWEITWGNTRHLITLTWQNKTFQACAELFPYISNYNLLMVCFLVP